MADLHWELANSPGRVFKLVDSLLDKADKGPLWLKDPRIARCVMDAIHFAENKLGFYSLHPFVIIPNHVHFLITPPSPLPPLINKPTAITPPHPNPSPPP